MTLRKKTIDNSAKYIPQTEQIQEKDGKPKPIKEKLLTRKQDKNLSQNVKKLIKKT